MKEAIEIFALSKKHGVPVFSSSALRFGAATQAVRAGQIGAVRSAVTSSPSPLEPNHIDLFWYGIHGVESLFTVVGTGWESVRRTSAPGAAVDLDAPCSVLAQLGFEGCVGHRGRVLR